MNRTPQSRRFWRILGPVMIYWGIQFMAQLIVQMIVMMLNTEKIVSIMQSSTTENIMEKTVEMSALLVQLMMEHQSLISAFVAACTIPIAAFFFSRDRKMEKAAQIPVNKKAPYTQYIWILLFGTAFCFGMNVIIIMSGLAMKDTTFISSSEVIYSEGIVVMLLCQGVIVPIAEELMFRGVLFKRCREQMRFFGAAFSVSCFFAFIHGSVTQLAYTLILGMFLAYFYEKFGSLKAAVFLHMLVNVISIVITKTGVLVWICSDLMRMAVCVVVCAFIGAAAFVKIQRIEEKPEIHVEIP